MQTIKRYAVFIPTLFFIAWGSFLLISHQQGTLIRLKTDPVDPRDLLRGHYVILRYAEFENIKNEQCPSITDGSNIYFQLAPDPLKSSRWKPTTCSNHVPAKSNTSLWVKGTLERGQPILGIEKFYVNEDSPLRQAQSGQVEALVRVGYHGEARLVSIE